MLTTEQVTDMLRMQRKLNECINPFWTEAEYNWNAAILTETAEAVDCCNWKWWKIGTTDTPALQMELVDIWHFLLSKTIEGTFTEDEAVELIAAHSRASNTRIAHLDEEDTIPLLLERFLAVELMEDDGIEIFLVAVCQAGMTPDDLYKQYMGKNILNKFRQDNGYKEGTYIRTWLGDKDDNEYLTELLRTLPLDTPEYGDKIYQGLAVCYEYAKEAHAEKD